MKFNRTTKQAVTNDIYKVCDDKHTKQIIGEYSPTSRWNFADILKAVSEVCLQRTSLEDWCDNPENPSADTILKRISELNLTQIDQLVNGWINEQSIRLKFHGNTKLTISSAFFIGRPLSLFNSFINSDLFIIPLCSVDVIEP